MEFKDWIARKYLEWRGDAITGRSITQFAKYLGVSQSLMTAWLQGDKLPGRKSIQKLAEKYPEINEILEISYPETQEELEGLPPKIRRRIRSAIAEVNRLMGERGITGEMAEAEILTIQIFEKWGLKYISTETVPDTE